MPQSDGGVRMAAERKENGKAKHCRYWVISAVQQCGCLASGILVFRKCSVDLVRGSPSPSVEKLNFPFPACTDGGLKELKGQYMTSSFDHIHVNLWCSKKENKKKKEEKNPMLLFNKK